MLLDPLRKFQKAKKRVYLVTDKRAIFIEGSKIGCFLPNELTSIYRRQRSDKSGDVIFTVTPKNFTDYSRKSKRIGFMEIRNPQQVEKLLKHLVHES